MSSVCHILWHDTHASVSSVCPAQRPELIPIEFHLGLIVALELFYHFVQSELYNFVFNFSSNIGNKDYFLGLFNSSVASLLEHCSSAFSLVLLVSA